MSYLVTCPGGYSMPDRHFAGWVPKSGLRRYTTDEREARHFATFPEAVRHRQGHDLVTVCRCKES